MQIWRKKSFVDVTRHLTKQTALRRALKFCEKSWSEDLKKKLPDDGVELISLLSTPFLLPIRIKVNFYIKTSVPKYINMYINFKYMYISVNS
jgi:hypothetical protein